MMRSERESKGLALFAVCCALGSLMCLLSPYKHFRISIISPPTHATRSLDELINHLGIDPIDAIPLNSKMSYCHPMTVHVTIAYSHDTDVAPVDEHMKRLLATMFHLFVPLGNVLRLHVDVHHSLSSSWSALAKAGQLPSSLFMPSQPLHSIFTTAARPTASAARQSIPILVYVDTESYLMRISHHRANYSSIVIGDMSLILGTDSVDSTSSMIYAHVLQHLHLSSRPAVSNVIHQCLSECVTRAQQLREIYFDQPPVLNQLEDIENRLFNLSNTFGSASLFNSLYKISDDLDVIYTSPELPDFSTPWDVQAAILFPYWFPIIGPLLLVTLKLLRRNKIEDHK